MTNCINRFEVLALRPIWGALIVAALFFGIETMWWWLVGCVAGIMYLGVIGSRLHPLLSAGDLSQGTTTGPRAATDLLPVEMQFLLVGQACTRLGLLLGITLGIAAWGFLGWPWYAALPVGVVATVMTGAIMKFYFVLRPTSH